MIQKEHLNVVSVCTPHPIHCDPAVTAAENGCNVLIEKPLASSLADCDRIIEAGDKNHVTIGTMVQRRFYRPCMRIHAAIAAGKIGKTVLVIDEAQDMADDEYALVTALMTRNEEMRVIAVGDDDQNIYEFRGSDSDYMFQ